MNFTSCGSHSSHERERTLEEDMEREYEDANSTCPNRPECNWVTVHVKRDKCTKCGDVFDYP